MQTEIYLVKLGEIPQKAIKRLEESISEKNYTVTQYAPYQINRLPLEVARSSKIIMLGHNTKENCKYEMFGYRMGWDGHTCSLCVYSVFMYGEGYRQFRKHCRELNFIDKRVIVPPVRPEDDREQARLAQYDAMIIEFLTHHFDEFMAAPNFMEDSVDSLRVHTPPLAASRILEEKR